ncbi:MAG: hypothetical protein ACE144_15510 [Thermodesulfobacteriota bacterium]
MRRIILPLLLIYIGVGVIATIRNMRIRNHEYAAVLLSDYAIWEYDYWASPAAFLGAYIPWTYYFNNRGIKVRWFLRAKSIDLEKVIRDKDCQSIVLVGHGSLNCWQATDRLVSNSEVSAMMEGVPKKRGEWMQLSCAEEDAFPVKMGELVMEKKERVYTYSKSINFYILVTDALSGFKYLKSLNR